MKVITENQERNVISVDELTDNHTLVLIVNDEVRISKIRYLYNGKKGNFALINISKKILDDGYTGVKGHESISKLANDIDNYYGESIPKELHAFNSLKEALEFAITKL